MANSGQMDIYLLGILYLLLLHFEIITETSILFETVLTLNFTDCVRNQYNFETLLCMFGRLNLQFD